MEKFTIQIDLEMEEIIRAYQNFFNSDTIPTKKKISGWIALLVYSDIESFASYEKEQE